MVNSGSSRFHAAPPLVGITCDLSPDRHFLKRPYVDAVLRAGGVPLALPSCTEHAARYVELCSALILTGGDDPTTEPFGEPTHPKATTIDTRRQAMELALLDCAAERPGLPVLGICLGMQLMALHAGGSLDQHLPDTLQSHAQHWRATEPRALHPVHVRLLGREIEASVLSHHRQAVRDAGSLVVEGRAPDGVIECIADPARRFYVGVQWHPERTEDEVLGQGLFEALVGAAREHGSATPGSAA